MLKIGLEIHCKLNTTSKLFSRAKSSGSMNTEVYPFDIGLPGSLPNINMFAVGMALKAALAFKCKISSPVKFDRKHYTYPDLFVGYQVTQKFNPLGVNGKILAVGKGDPFVVDIECIQLEQDTAKTIVAEDGKFLLDANRAGTPLIEIVTAPKLHSADDTISTLKAVQGILRILKISDAELESGSFRCDVNISKNGNNRIELKNLNSFKDIRNAIEFESRRQDSEDVVMETRRWDAVNQTTFPLRLKEATSDYRFLPDADIPLVHIPDDVIHKVVIPKLPVETALEFEQKYKIDRVMAFKIAGVPAFLQYFRKLSLHFRPKDILKWISEYEGKKNPKSIYYVESLRNSPVYNTIPLFRMTEFLSLIVDRKVVGLNTKKLFNDIIFKTGSVNELSTLYLVEPVNIRMLVDTVMSQNPKEYNNFKTSSGKEKKKALSWLTGKVLKLANGKVDPIQVTALIMKDDGS
eukprot:NODE_178_length_15814_cov_0.338657.p5 type:complete len:464 gc:universal NODE_178_length_15814_cov_0.338657:759-2150(+)